MVGIADAVGTLGGSPRTHGLLYFNSSTLKNSAACAFEAKKPLEMVKLDFEGPKAGEVLVESMASGIC